MRKINARKTLSLVMVLTLLLTSLVLPFGVFASETPVPDTSLLLNRDFEDKTEVTNGFKDTQFAGNTITMKSDGDNTYMHWVYDTTEVSTKHGHFNINISSYLPEEGSVVLRAKVRTTDASSTSRIALLVRPYDYHHGASIQKPDGSFYGYKSSMTTLLTFTQKYKSYHNVGALKLAGSNSTYYSDEFVEIAYVFTWTDRTSVTVNSYYDGSMTSVGSTSIVSYGVDARPCYFRFQVNTGTNLSWDIDDLQLYVAYTTDPTTALNVEFENTYKGKLYNSAAGSAVDPNAYKGHYFYKVNTDKALDKDGSTVYTLKEKPFSDSEGRIWFPISSLEHIGTLLPGAPISTVDGVRVVLMQDIPRALEGYYASYDSSGLVAISTTESVFVEGASKTSVIPVMQKFLFDNVDSSLGKVEAFAASEGQYLDHPYLFANQQKFDELSSVYLDKNGNADPVLKEYIVNRVNAGINVYKNYANEPSGRYLGIKTTVGLTAAAGQTTIYEMPYLNAQGYDIGGRHSQATSHANNIMLLAFAFQMTKEEKYARLAYDYAVAIGGWEHWGPGHFLNCADAAAPYSIAFDWLYDEWERLSLDVAKIEEIIFTHGVVPGFYSRKFNTIPRGWMRFISGVITESGWGFNGENNWNAVCSSGMVIASLAIVGKTTDATNTYIDTTVNKVPFEKSQLVSALGDHTGMKTYQDYAEWLINECLYGMAMNGLDQYIPDGSYIESSGYWSYGTNNFFEMVAALTTATEYNTGEGNDFGMLDAWGIDRTCYYALNTQSSDFVTFNYHDSGAGTQDTSWFPFYGNYTGKVDLAAIRVDALATGKSGSPTIQDILFYVKPVGDYKKPDLQYWWEGINGYVMRDSWESGAIYAGIMGDTNNLGHGQVDSGSFVYHNGGTVWFCDIGTENYNCYGFWGGATRYRYYKMNAEGNNTLLLANRSDVPYGQSVNGFGKMILTADNDYGALSVIDNTTVYDGYAKYAYRGMLMTNDRRTVVIQDEAEFVKPETLYWVGHTEQSVVLSVDGTVAYMTDGNSVIRVSIIDKSGNGAKFTLTDCYTFLLDASEGMDELAATHAALGTHEPNDDRSKYKRLCIKLENVTEVKLAVVIEEIAVGELSYLGYEWQDIEKWSDATPTSDGSVSIEEMGFFGNEEGDFGKTSFKGGNLSLSFADVSGSPAYVLGATSSKEASSFGFGSIDRLAEFGYLGDRIIAAELDISSYDGFPSGVRISLAGARSEIVGAQLSELCSLSGTAWKRLSFIIDGRSDATYIFLDDVLVSKGTYNRASVEDLEILVSTPAGSVTSGTLILDNLSLRAFGSTYTELDAALTASDISLWADRLPVSDRDQRPLASIVLNTDLVDGSIDTPLFNLHDNSHYFISDENGNPVAVVEFYRWSDLEAAMFDDAVVNLYSSNYYNPINVNHRVTFITNGNELYVSSDRYIAYHLNDRVELKEGSVTVSWHTLSGIVSEVYTSSKVASYKGTDLANTIFERRNGDSFEYYVKDGWSHSEGGVALETAGLIVTNQNNVFYQSEREYDGAFVAIKGKNILGYDDPDMLFGSVLPYNYDKICLLTDVVFDSTNINHKWAGSVNLYLNGHEIIYRSDVTSDHMYSSNGNLNIYGPGRLIGEAPTSNLFLATGGKAHIENVVIESVRSITDHRGGVIEFVNCDITITKGGISAFGVRNRNNVNTNPNNLPTVLLDGCRINMPYSAGSNSVFSVACNSVLSVTNTEINVSSGSTLFSLSNSVVGADSSYSFEKGYSMMKVKIGNIVHNCMNFAVTSSNDPSGNKYPDMVEKIGYVNGAFLSEYDGKVNTFDGCIVARVNDSTNPYIVTLPENAALVTWRVGTKTVSEYWMKGSIPSADSKAVKEILGSAEDGRKYSFTVDTLMGDTTYDAVYVTDFPVKMNLALYNGFIFNIYVGINPDVEIVEFRLDGESINGNQYTLDGEEYIKLSVVLDDPSNAAKQMNFVIRFNDTKTGVSGAVLSYNISLSTYIKEVLESDATPEEKGLMGNVLKYVKTAYEYTDNRMVPEYRSLVSLLTEYPEYSTVSAVRREAADVEDIKFAINAAALSLTVTPAYRFYVADGFEGEVVFSYVSSFDGRTVERRYTTENNLRTETVDGVTVGFFEIEMRPYELDSVINIRVTDGERVAEANYSLACYYHAVAKETGDITELVNAVYAYAESARLARAIVLPVGK